MKKRVVVAVSLLVCFFALNFVFAEEISDDIHLNIQVTNATGGILVGTFNFVFNISTNDNCSVVDNVIYSNSTNLTTDARGIISYYLRNVSLNYSEQYYLCYYRDGVLEDSSQIARVPYTFRAENISLTGVEIDSNLDLGNYNITGERGFFNFLGSVLDRIGKLFVQDIDFNGSITGTGNITTSGNITGDSIYADYYYGNGSYLTDINETLKRLNCANEQVVKWNSTSEVWYCSDISSPGVGDIDAVNTPDQYLTGGQTSGSVDLYVNETSLNKTIDNRIFLNNNSIVNWATSTFTSLVGIVNMVGNWSEDKTDYYNITQIDEINTSITNTLASNNQSITNSIEDNNQSVTNTLISSNESMKNYVDMQNTSQTNYINLVGSRWEANYTNMQNPCSPNFVVGIFENGTFMCGTIEQAAEEDPYWQANYTAYNESWSNTFNQSVNDSINNYILFINDSIITYITVQNDSIVNYIALQNGSIINYINEQNDSLMNWINSTFVSNLDLEQNVGNWSADKPYYYNKTEVYNKTESDLINASVTNTLTSNNQNITNSIESNNQSLTNTITSNNQSITNSIESNNQSITNTIATVGGYWNANYTNMQNPCSPNFVVGLFENGTFMCGTVEQAAENDPYWQANYTLYNESWSNTFNATTNTSITNTLTSNNQSLTNTITSNNQSITNSLADNNQSITNTLDSNNNSIMDWVLSTFTSISNIVSMVGNWSADKPNYYNTTQINEINTSITNTLDSNNQSVTNSIESNNESVTNSIADNNQSITNTIATVGGYWNANYTNMQNPCSPNFVVGLFENGTFMCGTVEQAAENDPYWGANYTLYNESWSNTFNQSVNDSINNYILFINDSIITYITVQNDSIVNYIALQNGSIINYINEQNDSLMNWINSTFVSNLDLEQNVGNWSADKPYYYNKTEVYNKTESDLINTSVTNTITSNNQSITNALADNNQSITNTISTVGGYWNANYTNMQNPCSPNFVVGLFENGTFMCGTVEQAAENDPYWGANYTLYNESWSNTFNQSVNDSINNYILFINDSIITYITVQNDSIVNYIALQNGSIINYVNENNQSIVNWVNGSFLTEEETWIANYTNMQNPCSPNFVVGLFENGTFMCGTVEQAAENDPYWGANYTAYNESWSNTFNQSVNDSITNTLDSMNTSNNNYILDINASNNNFITSNNQSIVNWALSTFTSISNIVAIIGNWSEDKPNYYNTTQINEINTSVTNTIISTNDSMKDYVDIQNDSQTNFIISNNISVNNYINTTNTSMRNYVDDKFLTQEQELNLSVNNSDYLDSYDSSFFMPLNNSVYGQFDFNGGWLNDGLSIIGGNMYAQVGYFYNISSLQVANLNINGSLYPVSGFDNQFDIGSPTLRWRDLNLGGEVYSDGTGDNYFLGKVGIGTETPANELNVVGDVNITGTLYVGGINISENNLSIKNYIDSQDVLFNDSNNNYIVYTNNTMKDYVDAVNSALNASNNYYIDLVGSRWEANYTNMQNPCSPNFVVGIFENGTFMCGTIEQASESDPYWKANYTLYNESWSNTFNATTNTSITNTLASNNQSLTDTITSNNQSITNALADNNESVNNFITSNNQSIVNWASSTFTSISNIVAIIGNWSEDKPNYYNTTQIDEINTSVTNTLASNNQSITDTITSNNQSITNALADNNESVTSTINTVGSRWEANYTNMQGDCPAGTFAIGIFENGSVQCSIGTVVEVDPYWTGNQTNYYNKTEVYNKTESDLINASQTNYIDLVGSRWEANYTNMQGDCPAGTFAIGIFENGTIQCSLTSASESDPYWESNYTAYNESWSNTFNATTNTSITNTLASNNQSITNALADNNESVNNFITSNNQSIVDWASSTFTSISNIVALVGNWSADKPNYYNTTQIDEMNNSNNNYIVYTNGTMKSYVDVVDLEINSSNNNYILWVNSTNHGIPYNDDWINDTFYNKTQIVEINTSMYNYIVYTNGTMKSYVDAVDLEINTSNNNYVILVNSTMKEYVDAVNTALNISNNNYILEINNSINNTLSSMNASQTNYINLVGSRWEANYTNMQTPCGPNFVTGVFSNGTFMCGTVSQASEIDPYWEANYTAYNESWSNTFNATTNTSITNTLASNNQSITNAIEDNNQSVTNFITSNNQSIVDWASSTFTSLANVVNAIGNWSEDKPNYYNTTQIDEINTSNNNYIASVNASLNNTMNTMNNSNNNYINYTNETMKSYVDAMDSAINTSNNNYILWVNSTNTPGLTSEEDPYWRANWTAYNASWGLMTNSSYIPYGAAIMNTNPFGGDRLYINSINNPWYLFNERYSISGTYGGTYANLFDGNYESNYAVSAGTTETLTMDWEGVYSGYPYGDIYVSFYYTYIPENVTGRVYTNYAPHGVGWHDLTFTKFKSGSSATIYKARNSIYAIEQLEISVQAQAGTNAHITQIEMNLDRPGIQEMPFIDKYRANTLYKDLNFVAGTVKINGSAVWYPGNDGSGSGLDADTLDSVHMGSITQNYITKMGASSTISQSGIYDNGTFVGIGTAVPQQKLHVVGNILANGTINATTDVCIQGGTCLSNVIGSETDPRWTANYTAYNESWSNTFNATTNDSITNTLGSMNASNNNYILETNTSMKNYIDSVNISMNNTMNTMNNSNNYYIAYTNNTMKSYVDAMDSAINTSNNNYILWVNSTNTPGIISEEDPYWRANYTNMQGDCPAGTFAIGIFENGSVQCSIGTVVEVDPYWEDNYTAYNASWSNTFNATTNTSITNTLASNNQSITNALADNNESVTNFITSNNQSIVNWASSTFTSLTNVVNAIGNWSEDKPNYYNTTQINEMNTSNNNYITSVNTSMNNTINTMNTSNNYYINLVGSRWEANYTNMQGDCSAGSFAIGIFENGSVQCAVGTASETDPYWTGNLSNVAFTNVNETFNQNLTVIGNFSVDENSLFIDSNNNRVGIGTSTPQTTFHILSSGSASLSRSFILENTNSGTTGYAQLGIKPEGSEGWTIGSGGSGEDYYGVSGKFYIFDWGLQKMRLTIDSFGNIGIGTTSPQRNLHVNGSILSNGTINATIDVCIEGGNCLSNVIGSETDPRWSSNYTAYNASWSNTFNATTNTSITNTLGSMNASNNYYIAYTNTTMKSYVDAVNAALNASNNYYINLVGSRWEANYTNMQGDCSAGSFAIGIFENGSVQCAVGTASETDPYWTGNLSNVAFTNVHETFTENVTLTSNLSVGGSINITTNNQKIYYGTGGEQYYNGSCMIIKGPTSTLEIC